MMNEWFTAIQLAELPGLPKTDRAIRIKAEKEGWQSRKRETGKGLEYHISSLPMETQKDLAKQHAKTTAASESPAAAAGRMLAGTVAKKVNKEAQISGLQQLIVLPETARKRADAKLLIIDAAATFNAPYLAIRQGVKGEQDFCKAYNEHSIFIADWVYQTIPNISTSSVRRWKDTLDKCGPAALAGRYNPVAVSKIDETPQLSEFLVAVLHEKPHLANKWNQLHKLLTVYITKHDLPVDVPSMSSIRRWVTGWMEKNVVAFTYVTDPKGYNNKYRTAIETMYPWMKSPNDVWEFDSTPVDAMLKEGRHSIIAVIDVYTRRVKLLVSPSSSSQGICLLLRKTILDWGTVNEGGIARTDNGSDYVSSRVTAIADLLGMDISKAKPYSGWEKPHIERFFRTLSHDMIELLPGYIGHCVADREVIEGAKEFSKRLSEARKPEEEREGFDLRLTQHELQQFLDDWVDGFYNNNAHDGLGGKSPNEMYWEAKYQPKRITDEGALDLLLNHVGTAQVLKGFIKKNGLEYTAEELLNHDWKAQTVDVFLDPTDVGRAWLYRKGDMSVRVEAHDRQWLGRSVSPDSYRDKKREDKKALSEYRRGVKGLAKVMGIDELPQDVISHFMDKAKQVTALHKPTIEHSNETIKALADAVESVANPLSVRYSDSQIKHLEQKRALLEQREQEISQQRGLVIRNEHDKARMLAESSLTRELTEKEFDWLKGYMKNNKLGARTIEKIMAGRKQVGTE